MIDEDSFDGGWLRAQAAWALEKRLILKLPEITISLFLRLDKNWTCDACCQRRKFYSPRYGTNNRLKKELQSTGAYEVSSCHLYGL